VCFDVTDKLSDPLVDLIYKPDALVEKGKRKVVPVLSLTEHHVMNVYWGVDV
jgi:hypothetical protein